ncbi:peptidase [Vibrio sp. 10N.286.49.B3]|uniref:M14 family metallopeptidase n=1 Tax=Vibrio sp. 10N.286.49.B3 TaxID=1880855 RepID=UPI000C82AE15|nr:M14 family metallocarboxypeptidase [Vibrio sp. 10N.286.49.B3]PMH43179.1 peptidase [Vibrio sp. 10N.286.49.B3]
MDTQQFYPIGTPGQAWTDADKLAWRKQITVKRSYQQEVVSKIHALSDRFDIEQYGALSYDPERFPLFAIKSKQWDSNKATILITGGVHGYETSGVHGALQFLNTHAEQYSDRVNIIVAPCISPWGYEVINRWNPLAIDPNRSFYADSPAEESAAIMAFVAQLDDQILMHIDLHETTDSDETEFRPALMAREGLEYTRGMIPDGFYTVGDTENPMPDFQRAIIESVEKVTHIAPADDQGEIIGSPVVQTGVINYPMKKLALCGGMTNCQYGSTTEVYPDSPAVTDEECNSAQVAAIVGGLDFVLAQK